MFVHVELIKIFNFSGPSEDNFSNCKKLKRRGDENQSSRSSVCAVTGDREIVVVRDIQRYPCRYAVTVHFAIIIKGRILNVHIKISPSSVLQLVLSRESEQ